MIREKISKREGVSLVILALVVLILLPIYDEALSQPKSAPAKKTYNLKFLDIYPLASPASKTQKQFFCERVTQLSGGRIKIKIYPIGTLADTPEYPEMVRDGTADIAYLFNAYYADRFPLAEVWSLPFLVDSYRQAVDMSRELFKTVPGLRDPLDRYNLKPLWYTNGHTALIQTKKPVKTLNDMKGLKLVTAGGLRNRTVKSLGAVPLTVPPGDTYSALQSGVGDGLYMAAFFQELHKFYEVAPYFLNTPKIIIAPLAMTVINKKLWNSMSKEDQEIIQRAALEEECVSFLEYEKEDAEVLDRMKAKGCTINMMSNTEMAKFKESTKMVHSEWINANPGGSEVIKRVEAWKSAHPDY
ncbi:hypothetical protein AMJ44_11330 [candidate division WOR-1 bacterium DG_54_3]|uniref:C4-dicarboxylate ABC transporter substrate-binding protein n=1 Tax=candidate division WOR-1 bacterium DG_54_3 TaxID=1703775 RepID=A0A0S7XRI6_UNCSA|nr:MAG: hypothetical protein AMJ44_11330 [candidate division WOR-1 bacterium DG_54_3]